MMFYVETVGHFCWKKSGYAASPCAKQANPADLRGSLRFKSSNKQRSLP
jgi:hypothetical protein